MDNSSSENTAIVLAAYIIRLSADFSRALGEKYACNFLKSVKSFCEALNKRAIHDFYNSINSGEKFPF